MIFVTVGTHEQQFNRLVEYMDKWAIKNDEEVVIQIGYSTYKPRVAKWSKLFTYRGLISLITSEWYFAHFYSIINKNRDNTYQRHQNDY